ncbi:MAG: hypothetical protein IKY33_00910 [Clostridia bacterium]|nr:hypothetical protein [Clostridia bacterium]
MKKILSVICVLLCLCLAGCAPGYEQTEQTEKALETYYAAVKASEAATAGEITVDITLEDTIVAKNTTTEHYVYTYTVQDGAELFDYACYTAKGDTASHYASTDKDTVIDKLTGAEVSDFDTYKKHDTNPLSNLMLFRMDANYRVQHNTISAITMQEYNGDTVISVTFHPDKLTSQSIKSEGGLTRTIVSHERFYTIRDGKIARIEIRDREHARYEGELGVMNTDIIVEAKY